jgi:hypothetical protein
MDKDILEIRKAFYDKFTGIYNTSKEEIAKILITNGFESFKKSEINQYAFCISAYFDAQKDIKGRADKAIQEQKKSRESVFGVQVYYPCPIPGCAGVKVFSIPNRDRWHCSERGFSHWLAWKTAKLWIDRHPGTTVTQEEKAAEFAGSLKENYG